MKTLVMAIILGLSLSVNAQNTKMKVKQPARATATETDKSEAPTSVSTLPVEYESVKANGALSASNFYPAMGAKVFKITPTLSTTSSSYDLKTYKESRTGTGVVTNINYQARLNSKAALEFQTDFGTQDIAFTSRAKGSTAPSKLDARTSGVSDFHFILKNQQEKGAGNAYFGADLGISPASHEVSESGNRSSGGHSLTPFFAYEQFAGARVVGIKGAITLKADRAIEYRQPRQRAVTMTEVGGHQLSLSGFSEWQANRAAKVGLMGRIDLPTDTTLEQPTQKIDYSSSPVMTLGVYGERAVTKSMSLVPALSFSTLLGRGTGSVESNEDLSVGLGARIAL